jgi:hypothetical protein
VEDGHVPAAARELLRGEARDGRAAARVVPAERGHQQAARAGAARAPAGRRPWYRLRPRPQPCRQLGERQQPALERVGEAVERLAIGVGGVEDRPVQLGHELAQRVELHRTLERPLDVGDLLRARRLVGRVRAVAAEADQRPAGDVAEAVLAGGAQPEVEVLRDRIGAVVAADRLVDAPVHHPRRVDEVVVRAVEGVEERGRREVAALPAAGDRAGRVDHERVAVHDARAGVAVEQRDLPREPVRQADVVVAEHRDQLAAALPPDRVVGGRDPAVLGVVHDAQALVVREAVEDRVDRRVRRPVADDEQLEVAVPLREPARDRLREVRVAVVGRDPERDARHRPA